MKKLWRLVEAVFLVVVVVPLVWTLFLSYMLVVSIHELGTSWWEKLK